MEQQKKTQTPTVQVLPLDLEASQHEPDSRPLSPEEKSLSADPLPLLRRVAIVTHLAGVNFASSAVNGIVVISLPVITTSLSLSPSLSYWPVSVFNLATASTLLLAGAFADVLGPRTVDLAGCFASGAFMIGAGASRTGAEIVGIRAMQGVSFALHLASSVGIVTQAFPRGKGRNFAFSCLGFSQPLGFSFGLVLGGAIEETVGWRTGWFIFGGLTLLLSTAGLWALPRQSYGQTLAGFVKSLGAKVDMVGAMIASAFMAMLCYLLAIISTDINSIRNAGCIVMLCLTTAALPAFVFWVHRQVRLGRPALIPNSLWRNSSFSTMCATIALSLAVVTALELFASLFFQQVQNLSPFQAGIRIVPSLVVGFLLNLTMGLFVHRIPPLWIVVISSVLCAGSPLLMALIEPQWSYWTSAFVAQLLQPTSADALFTVGLIIISEVFPDDEQSLAGAVFNTAAQLGSALGLAVMQVVSTTVTQQSTAKGGVSQTDALMQGYRASCWTMFGCMVLCGLLGVVGLRKTGRVGLKKN